MASPRDKIRRIIRRALDDARPQVVRRVAKDSATSGAQPLEFRPKRRRDGADSPRGLFNKRLVLSRDARAAFEPEVILSCYNLLRAAALQDRPLADVQEFFDPRDTDRRLAFAETAEHVLAYVPSYDAAPQG